jgi:hypothetical protein
VKVKRADDDGRGGKGKGRRMDGTSEIRTSAAVLLNKK